MALFSIIVILFCLCLTANGNFEDSFKNELLKFNISKSSQDKCMLDLQQMSKDLSKLKLSWSWKMLDSTSKIRSGIALLNDDIGQFNECVGSSNEDGSITGKYCLGNIFIKSKNEELQQLYETKRTIKKIAEATYNSVSAHPFTWAACLPSSCNSETFHLIFNSIFNKISPEMTIIFNENKCYSLKDDSDLTTGAIITIAIFSTIFIIMILSTCYDLYCQQFSKESNQLLLAFSMYTNSKKLFTMSTSNIQLECLNGLKFYSMLWVVVGHTYSLGIAAPSYNYFDIATWADKLYSMIIISGTLSVDTFFVVGGALVAYVYMQSMEKGKKFNIIIFYLHRYIRLTPALAALALFVAQLYPFLGSGPNWYNVKSSQHMCQDVWWATLTYSQNYLGEGMCAGHSWYLAVDMQLYLLSPFILYSLRRFPKQTIGGILAVILCICGSNFGLAWSNNYPAILSNLYANTSEFVTHFYIKTHARANAWLTGILVGYILHQIKQKELKLRLNKTFAFVAWLICLLTFLVCIFVGHDSLRTAEYQQWGNSLHIAFVRQCWSLGIGWMMVACVSGKGGPINWFLSLPIYQVFNRFAYSIYLIHFMLITLWYSSTKSPIFFSDFMMGYFFWGNLCFTCIVSYFWVLAFESPVIVLEKILLQR